MPEGLDTLSMKEALAAAKAELEPASSDEGDTGVPPVEPNAEATGEQALSPTQEQPAAEVDDGFSDEANQLAASLLDTTGDSQNGSDSGVVPGSDDFWNLGIDVQTVNGQETVTIQELSDGYLRQADYTQKTQSLAEQRKDVTEAVDFHAAFKADAVGFARSLAVQAGWISEGDEPIKNIDAAKIPTQDEMDSKLTEMVDERVKNDPRVKSAELRDAEAQLDTEYDALQVKYGIPLSSELRTSLTQEAIKTGSADLEGVLAKRLMASQQQQSKAGSTNLAATSRPGTAPVGGTTPEEEKTKTHPSMREAWQEAKVAAAAQQ